MKRLAPGLRLAVACAAWPLSDHRCEQIKRAAAEVTDWDNFTILTRRHRIGGLVQNALKTASLSVPPGVARQAGAIAVRGETLARETVLLQQAFATAGVPVAFVKGASLARAIFGDVGLRHSKDIDALVDRRQVKAAWAVLDSQGYRRVTPPSDLGEAQLEMFFDLSKDSTLHHPVRRVWVELHWRLTNDPGLPAHPDPSSWRQLDVGSGETVTTFGDEALFIYLCVHGATHGWKRLKWLADIAGWLNLRPEIVDEYWRVAAGTGAAAPVEVALRLSAAYFGSPLPKAMPKTAGLRVSLLLGLATVLLANRGETLLGPLLDRLAEPLVGLLLVRNPASAWAWVKHLMLPAEDVSILKLHPSLWFVYLLARLPLWAFKNRFGQRGSSAGRTGRRPS